jgi:hypothetical protein
MTEYVAPQEDQLQLPTGWSARLLSRRGRRTGKPVELDPEAAMKLRRKLEGRATKVRLAFLAGEPDPQGAAVVAALMCDENVRHHSSWLRPELDAWAGLHGLPFAVAAAVERLAFHHEAQGNGNGYDNRVIVDNHFEYMSMHIHEYEQGGLADVRAIIADLSDEAYADVVAAVADVRDTPMKRINAAVLLPDETDWVDEAAVDYAQLRSYGWTDPVMIQTFSTEAQFTAATSPSHWTRASGPARSARPPNRPSGASSSPTPSSTGGPAGTRRTASTPSRSTRSPPPRSSAPCPVSPAALTRPTHREGCRPGPVSSGTLV